ncbi:MAG: LPXTG cell wall anchor domain-containing protein, partial [Lactobacillus sp.]|nr:LPXTG cell wall anchor domain-containing protein [Lactobacillus sp.]
GYYADKANAGGTTITPEDLNKKVIVTYAPNGMIIPVVPYHNPIPNVPQPQYLTDPKDPSKVTPNEPVPDIPGYTPSTPTVTPTDPGKATPVIYTPDEKDQTVTIKYIDDATGDAHTNLSSYNKSIIVKPRAALNYSTKSAITELENKSYILVSDNFNVTTMPEKGGSYEVHLNHKMTTITPRKPGKPGEPINPNDPDAKNLTKDGSQTIHYVYSDGKPAANDSVQNTQFEHTLVFDNVTGKQIEDRGWSPESHKFNDVTSPTIDGYHADKTSVEGATVTLDNPTSEITVVYTKNSETGKANGTVTYIDDETGKTLRTDMLAGNVGEKIAYTTQDKLEEFGQEGYKLVSNSFQDGQEVFAKEGNNFIVHLKKASAPQPNPHKDDPTPQPDPESQSNPDHDIPKPNTPKDSSSQPPKNAPQTSNHKNDQPEKPSCLSDPKQKPYTQASNKSDEKKALKESKNTPVVKKHVNKSIKKVVSHKKATKTEKIETKTSTKVVSNDPKIVAKTAERCAMIQGNDKKLPQTGEADNVLGLIGLMIVSLTGISIFDVDRKRN